MRLLRTLTVFLTLTLLVTGVASSETKVGSNVDVRTIVALKIADAEAQRLLPAGWQVAPVASGPNQGANLSLTFLDQLLNQDPEGKPAGSAPHWRSSYRRRTRQPVLPETTSFASSPQTRRAFPVHTKSARPPPSD
jgi:hypothetical protein